MSKYQDGEHICLYFESYENEEFFKGWLSEDECKSAIIPSYGDDCRIVQVKRHTYARWNIGRDECGDPTSYLHETDKPARGAFKVTVCESDRCY